MGLIISKYHVWKKLMSLDDGSPHFYVINRSVIASCGGALNHLHDIKPFLHLTEHGILPVKMRRATYSGINPHLLVGKADGTDTLLRFSNQLVLQLLKTGTVTIFSHL